jgi:hypothetical protein
MLYPAMTGESQGELWAAGALSFGKEKLHYLHHAAHLNA